MSLGCDLTDIESLDTSSKNWNSLDCFGVILTNPCNNIKNKTEIWCHRWFRYWRVACSAPRHYLNRCWLFLIFLRTVLLQNGALWDTGLVRYGIYATGLYIAPLETVFSDMFSISTSPYDTRENVPCKIAYFFHASLCSSKISHDVYYRGVGPSLHFPCFQKHK